MDINKNQNPHPDKLTRLYENLPEDLPETEPKGNSFFDFILELFQIMIIVVVITWVIKAFIFQPFLISGASMEPSVFSGEVVIVDEFSYNLSDPKRGDIVVLDPPRDSEKEYIKRIIGLPGETVEITDKGTIEINGKEISEPYLYDSNQFTKGTMTLTVPANEYFVLGDNRAVSNDGRGGVSSSTGKAMDPWTVQKDHIVGHVAVRFWPLNSFSWFSHQKYFID